MEGYCQPEWTPAKAGNKAHLIIYWVWFLTMGCACLMIPFDVMPPKDSQWNWDYFHLSEWLHCLPQNFHGLLPRRSQSVVPKNFEQMKTNDLIPSYNKLLRSPFWSWDLWINRPGWIRCGNESRLMATSIWVLFKYARKSKGGNKLYLQRCSTRMIKAWYLHEQKQKY
jgi:hypothetical protein